MKKIILLLLLALCDLNACNLVPVIKSLAQNPEVKTNVYRTICENSLPILQSKELPPETIATICSDPCGFLKSKILEHDNSAEVLFIPKTLYQMFVYAHILHKVLELHTDKKEVEVFYILVPKMDERGITFFIGENCENQSFNCSNCMNRPQIEKFFWELNDSIVQFLEKISWGNTQDQLSFLTHSVIDDITESRAKVWESGASQGMIYGWVNWEASQQLIDVLVQHEYMSGNSYIIYRGTSKFPAQSSFVSQMPTRLDHSFSFSDGAFGGLIYDAQSGMAFRYWNKVHPLLSIHIDLEDLLYRRNGAEIFHIPPMISLGAVLGYGELHHVRTKVLQKMGSEAFKTDKIACFKINPVKHPELFIASDEGLFNFIQNYDGTEKSFILPIDGQVSKWRLITIEKKKRYCEIIDLLRKSKMAFENL